MASKQIELDRVGETENCRRLSRRNETNVAKRMQVGVATFCRGSTVGVQHCSSAAQLRAAQLGVIKTNVCLSPLWLTTLTVIFLDLIALLQQCLRSSVVIDPTYDTNTASVKIQQIIG